MGADGATLIGTGGSSTGATTFSFVSAIFDGTDSTAFVFFDADDDFDFDFDFFTVGFRFDDFLVDDFLVVDDDARFFLPLDDLLLDVLLFLRGFVLVDDLLDDFDSRGRLRVVAELDSGAISVMVEVEKKIQ